MYIDDLLGVPFKIHGRSKKGFDCYGLVLEIEKRLGREMPDLYREYTEETCEEEVDKNAVPFIRDSGLNRTNEPVMGDVILFYDEKGRAVHVGVYLKNGEFIHCNGLGVNVMKLDKYFRKVWEIYTWQN